MGKEFEGLEEGLKAKIYLDSLRATLKMYQTEKCLAMMASINSGFKNSLPSTTDWQSK